MDTVVTRLVEDADKTPRRKSPRSLSRSKPSPSTHPDRAATVAQRSSSTLVTSHTLNQGAVSGNTHSTDSGRKTCAATDARSNKTHLQSGTNASNSVVNQTGKTSVSTSKTQASLRGGKSHQIYVDSSGCELLSVKKLETSSTVTKLVTSSSLISVKGGTTLMKKETSALDTTQVFVTFLFTVHVFFC